MPVQPLAKVGQSRRFAIESKDTVQFHDEKIMQILALWRQIGRPDRPVIGDPRDIIGYQSLEKFDAIRPPDSEYPPVREQAIMS